MPPQTQGQNRQQGQNHPQQGMPWTPPPNALSPTAVGPTEQPTTVVNTMAGQVGGYAGPGGQPATQPTVPGLGLVTFLLVLGAIAFAVFVARDWFVGWGTAIGPCLDGGGAWECIVNDTGRTRMLLPLVAVLAAFSLARGAAVERAQGRGIGYFYALLGFGVLALAWSLGAAG